MAHAMIDAFRETVGQPMAIHFELVGELDDHHGYDVVFQPEMEHYGLKMYAQAMFLDGERWDPVGSGYRECYVKKLWHLYGFQGESRVVLELSDEPVEGETFEVEEYNVFLDGTDKLYDKIEQW